MKIIGLSDTHGNDVSGIVPECDVLLLCGDISPNKMSHGIKAQKKWFQTEFISHLQKYKNKAKSVVFCAGNHDGWLYHMMKGNQNDALRAILPDGVHYLCNESIVIDGVKIYGNPWCNAPLWAEVGPPVWNFASHNYGFLKALYDGIPNDVDILMSHGPAYGFCDQILDENLLASAFDMYKDRLKAEHLGCSALADRIKEISLLPDSKLKFVPTGHIHSAEHFAQSLKKDINSQGVSFQCVSILDEEYMLGKYQPAEIQI